MLIPSHPWSSNVYDAVRRVIAITLGDCRLQRQSYKLPWAMGRLDIASRSERMPCSIQQAVIGRSDPGTRSLTAFQDTRVWVRVGVSRHSNEGSQGRSGY